MGTWTLVLGVACLVAATPSTAQQLPADSCQSRFAAAVQAMAFDMSMMRSDIVVTNEDIRIRNVSVKGSFETFNGVYCYVTGDKSSSKAIIYASDNTFFSVTNLKHADALAAQGPFLVVMPDIGIKDEWDKARGFVTAQAIVPVEPPPPPAAKFSVSEVAAPAPPSAASITVQSVAAPAPPPSAASITVQSVAAPAPPHPSAASITVQSVAAPAPPPAAAFGVKFGLPPPPPAAGFGFKFGLPAAPPPPPAAAAAFSIQTVAAQAPPPPPPSAAVIKVQSVAAPAPPPPATMISVQSVAAPPPPPPSTTVIKVQSVAAPAPPPPPATMISVQSVAAPAPPPSAASISVVQTVAAPPPPQAAAAAFSVQSVSVAAPPPRPGAAFGVQFGLPPPPPRPAAASFSVQSVAVAPPPRPAAGFGMQFGMGAPPPRPAASASFSLGSSLFGGGFGFSLGRTAAADCSTIQLISDPKVKGLVDNFVKVVAGLPPATVKHTGLMGHQIGAALSIVLLAAQPKLFQAALLLDPAEFPETNKPSGETDCTVKFPLEVYWAVSESNYPTFRPLLMKLFENVHEEIFSKARPGFFAVKAVDATEEDRKAAADVITQMAAYFKEKL